MPSQVVLKILQGEVMRGDEGSSTGELTNAHETEEGRTASRPEHDVVEGRARESVA